MIFLRRIIATLVQLPKNADRGPPTELAIKSKRDMDNIAKIFILIIENDGAVQLLTQARRETKGRGSRRYI
jgi:hypothetical protein